MSPPSLPPACAVAPRVDARPLPRVLYAIVQRPGDKLSSVEEQIAMLADAFRAEGALFHPLFICASAGASTHKYDERGIEATILDLMPFSRAGLADLLRLIDRQRIDIIHWSFTSLVLNPYVWVLSIVRPRLRHWYTDHVSKLLPLAPPPTGLRKRVKALLMRRYDCTICISGYTERFHRAHGLTDRLVTCLHFINTARFAPDAQTRAAVRRREGVESTQVLLYVGSLIREKGVDLLIGAMPALGPNVRLWVVGTGPVAAALEAQARALGVADRVRFLGQQVEVQPFMQAADALVCPSRWAEAAGMVNLEAQACGLPVVAARIGGIPEYVIDGQTGLLAEPESVEDLARQLRRVLDDGELRRRLGAAAEAHAAASFGPEAGLPPMLAAYRRYFAAAGRGVAREKSPA